MCVCEATARHVLDILKFVVVVVVVLLHERVCLAFISLFYGLAPQATGNASCYGSNNKCDLCPSVYVYVWGWGVGRERRDK